MQKISYLIDHILLKLREKWAAIRKIMQDKSHQFHQQRPITLLDMSVFLRQFATLLSAGIPIMQSCHILEKSQDKVALRLLIYTIKREILAGKNLFYCLKNFPNYFDELTCQLVYIGEQTGNLDKMLITIACYQEKNILFKNKIKRALFYPCIITLVAGLITLAMLVFVIPRFAELFHDIQDKLPFLTRGIFYFSTLVKQFMWLFIASLTSVIIVIYRSKKAKYFKLSLQKFIAQMPLLKPYLQKILLARFARNLALTFAAGLSVTEALKLSANNCGSQIFMHIIAQVHRKINSGLQLHHAMASFPFFPTLMIQMIKIGEESGMLEHMLNKTAVFFEADIDQWVERLNLLFEPLIMIVLGVLIGGLVIGMYLPLFKLGTLL